MPPNDIELRSLRAHRRLIAKLVREGVAGVREASEINALTSAIKAR